jgi:CHAD domain-containing protein
MDARYFDADDLRLLRAGMTMRHRTGEGGPEGTWTLKVAQGSAEDGFARRREHIVPGPLDDVPPDLLVLVRPWLRTAELQVVAHLRTVRQRTLLTAAEEVVGEVDDDEVSVVVDDHVAVRFREVEVETDDDALLGRLVEVMRGAGAGAPDPTPKLVRAIGPRALQPPDVVPIPVDERSSAADVLQGGIAKAVLRIMENDAAVRAGDPGGVHKARVSCRRLRSDLRTFAPLLSDGWADPIRDELRWLAGELGGIRDRDVLRERLEAQIATLPSRDAEVADGVLGRLSAERGEATTRAVAALDSHRYLELLDGLVDASAHALTTADAQQPAAEVLPGLARSAFDRLRKHVRRLPKHPPDGALHDLRIQAKRARYAADIVVPVVGKPAVRYTKAMGRLQDVLGDLQDCAVAEEWLHEAATSCDGPTGFVLGELAQVQRARAAELRGQWRPAWDDVAERARTGWMG